MVRIAADITWLVGRTPLVDLRAVSPPGVRVVGKLDAWNPSGSNKDRAALGMIEDVARAGSLTPGGAIVECSSGDLGVALATLGRRRGYRVVLTMPETVPAPRRALLGALGAQVEVTPSAEGMRGAVRRAEHLARTIQGAVCLQAFSNRANASAHAETTAREIWEDTDGTVDAVVVPVGTGGTAAGCVRFFERLDVRVVGVEPASSPVLSGGTPGPHTIPGLGAGFVPEILTPSTLHEVIGVLDEDAHAMTRRLIRDESLLLGPASGAVLHAALALAVRSEFAGGLVVAVLPDAAEPNTEHWMPEHLA